MLSACSASPLAHGRTAGDGSKDRCAGRAASSVSSGAAYHDSIASILRDAFDGERRSRDGKATSEKESEGSASEAADVRLGSFGLSRGLSAAAEGAFPEDSLPTRLGRVVPEERSFREFRRGL